MPKDKQDDDSLNESELREAWEILQEYAPFTPGQAREFLERLGGCKKGKYDGRKNNGRSRRGNKPGPKPQWMKHLSRNAAFKILKEFDAIVPPAEIYAWCWEHKEG